MFTVKVCEECGETLIEASSVVKEMTPDTAPDIGHVRVDLADGTVRSYPIFETQRGDSIYVMNRFGATVATYRL